jgi:hypothetical protein
VEVAGQVSGGALWRLRVRSVEVHCGGVGQVSGGALWRCESGGLSVEVYCGGVGQVSGGALWRCESRGSSGEGMVRNSVIEVLIKDRPSGQPVP